MNIIKGYRTRKAYQRTAALRAVSLALYDTENGTNLRAAIFGDAKGVPPARTGDRFRELCTLTLCGTRIAVRRVGNRLGTIRKERARLAALDRFEADPQYAAALARLRAERGEQ
ncbi:hypothetical protein DY245_08145 [Streptomyces inhibens]|uniref:Uncharacterized protein n=1 Tax=Streptomyces inhibens TaxID=2293571 RepID=A0A371Q7X0_STRIH|nr:hypothetical protein [Streptomyces inhibens]REK90807.1 hypothetical protein DY245_08145 [Streptomyces inhibens]